ncbi:DNA polymerase [Mesorhizobium erdmanii]|uniref:DNA polymerase n=1 Tax=Mesorhizobium erdmanii TaxID=1777866 RepID=UPI0003F63981|nr:DNA polymerase [Mesorhizobium erdmanii]
MDNLISVAPGEVEHDFSPDAHGRSQRSASNQQKFRSATANGQSYFDTTDHSLAPTTVVIRPENIEFPPKRKGGQKKALTTAHLIIGFDTEYQSRDAIGPTKAEAQGAENEILSYQFCTRLISQGHRNETPVQSSGIIVPKDQRRLLLRDFIAIAIGKFISDHPARKVPTDIYLVGHFTRADLPMFDEFADEAKATMSNVRSTFVSIDRAIPMRIVDGRGQEVAEFSIRLRDTILLAPANAKQLADVGKMLGFNKIELADTLAEEREIKGHMKQFRSENWPKFREYAIRDAEICTQYAEQLIRQYDELFGKFAMPLTLTSFGSKLAIAQWEQSGWKPDDVLGREEKKVQQFNKRLGRPVSKTIHPHQDLVHYELDFVSEAYHGGRNEQFLYGICDEGIWRDHDLSSAYPTAMTLLCKPDWERIERDVAIDEIELLDLAFASVDFEFPRSVRFPTLPVRTANGIIFPRKGRACCAAPELVLARQLGAELKLRRSVRAPVEQGVRIFSDFINDCITRRNEFDKGTFGNLFWKEVGNSTYGKTAQGLRKKRVYDLRADDMVELPESELTQPFFAAFITSYTRAVLGEVLNKFPDTAQVFSVTTDGFLSNAIDSDLVLATAGPIFDSFRQAKLQLGSNDPPIEVKHTIRQPLGWRTRGSATLQLGLADKVDKNIVLQKGGIKLDQRDLKPDEENAQIVELFFNRTAGQQLTYDSGVGLKDMIRFGADFVMRTVTKRVSMEFDWKRRPIDLQDRTVEFHGQTYTHLSFSSEPLEDFDEFQRVREAWSKWATNPFRTLKSGTDLRAFQHYLETKRKTSESVMRYAGKTDGDLKRAKRDLTRAFKHYQAGFDLVLKRMGKIKHDEFCDILNDVGIPCQVSDLDNAKRNTFEPHTWIQTERSITALITLKEKYFYELDVDMFLARRSPN